MKKIIFTFCFLITTNFAYSDNPKFHYELQNKINEASDNSTFPVYILLDEHLTLQDFSDIDYNTLKEERRKIVVDRLKNYSSNSQRNVREFLETKKSQRAIDDFEILWITNSIITTANVDILTELSEFDNVRMICYDATHPVEMLWDTKPIKAPFIGSDQMQNSSSPPQPGITLMKADLVWALGNKGRGVIVANADDGFWWKHPDLVNGIWQNLGEDANNNGMTVLIQSGTSSTFDPGDINGIDDDGNGKVDDMIGWDYTTNNYNITTGSHGSGTLGQVNGDGTGGTQTGVAPESKVILLRNTAGESAQWAAFQYAVEMGAHVITSSLSWKWYFNPKPNYSQMRLVTDMSLAAGVVHTNSTSNDGGSSSAPIPLNISSAGNCPPPWLHPEQLRVGNVSGVIGVGNVSATTDIISTSSPYGPATWGNWDLWGAYTYPTDPAHMDYPYSRTAPVELPDSMGLLKPDVSAPGNGTTSTYVSSGTGYAGFSGTSSATPHTAGCVALMLSVNPEMLPTDIDQVLELTSVEKGAPGKDPRYGTGRIDALAATTSPKFTLEGIHGFNDSYINSIVFANDTARELVGFKISTDVNPKIGSLRSMMFNIWGTANETHITSFDMYWDKDGNKLINSGDILLRSVPFATGPVVFDSLKFKFNNIYRNLIVSARTTASASNQYIVVAMSDTSQVSAYYNTKPFATNFPFIYPTGIENNSTVSELNYSLAQNYPNPFNPTTIINYTVAKDGDVKMKVFNALGKEVAVLVNGYKTKGNYNVEFDSNDLGSFSTGIYYYKIESGNFSEVKKMILIK
ncbi:MAG: S8 family serine peptidase [Ignavibacteria bacterium]